MSIPGTCRSALAAVGTCLALGGLGCGSGAGSGADAGSGGDTGPHLELGTGRAAFEVVPPDGRVPLIQGIQGGYHVWTSFLGYGFTAKVARMDLHTHWDGVDGSQVDMSGNVALQPGVDAEGNAVSMSIGWPAGIYQPTCADGQPIVLDITILDQAGVTASASARWIVDVAEEYRSTDCAP